MSLKNKIDFAVIFSVKNANPNGDPLNGNRPRTTLAGIGEISDVCIKRKLRDRLQEAGYSIFVQSDDRKIDTFGSLRERAAPVLPFDKPKDEQAKVACSTWFDVRAFGQLFAFKNTNQDKSKSKSKVKSKAAEAEGDEDSEDDNSASIGIRGPVSIHPAFSASPVSVTSSQITKSVSGEGDGSKRGSDTMGMKHRVDSGLYAFFGSMNPQLAEKTGFSDEDAKAIKAILPKMFENDASSARPDGSMSVVKVIWWEHNVKSGQYSSAKVHGSLHIEEGSTPPYKLTYLAGLKPEEIDGF